MARTVRIPSFIVKELRLEVGSEFEWEVDRWLRVCRLVRFTVEDDAFFAEAEVIDEKRDDER